MLPDLGKYAFAVLGSYGVALVLLAVLVGASVITGRRVKRDLARIEARNAPSSAKVARTVEP